MRLVSAHPIRILIRTFHWPFSIPILINSRLIKSTAKKYIGRKLLCSSLRNCLESHAGVHNRMNIRVYDFCLCEQARNQHWWRCNTINKVTTCGTKPPHNLTMARRWLCHPRATMPILVQWPNPRKRLVLRFLLPAVVRSCCVQVRCAHFESFCWDIRCRDILCYE